MNQNKTLLNQLNELFLNPDRFETCVPLFVHRELTQDIVVILADKLNIPPEPGEPGSILSYMRSYGYDDTVLCSDCYGQLSCSSCAVEVQGGLPENKTPREEEYDMLDIDDVNPPTKNTRLSCQTILGNKPLVLTIRIRKAF